MDNSNNKNNKSKKKAKKYNTTIHHPMTDKIDNKTDKIEICPCGDPTSHKYECSLYCGMFTCEDEMVKLPKCDHRIHQQCLESLLYTRLSSCPLCRSSINSIRTSKHYQKIEREIALQFQSDTELAIRLSREMFQQS